MAQYIITAANDMAAVMSDTMGEDEFFECLDGSSPQPQSLTLPPEVWAMVINYLPYDSLISCASTSRAILYDALPLVTTLHIEKASHLRLGIVSNHLRDIRNISICNLYRTNSIGEAAKIDEVIATKSVPFISKRFPHLESISFWGADGDNLLSLDLTVFNPGGIYQLFDSFSSAFDSGDLPHNLQLVGLRCPSTLLANTGDCKVCKRICKKFPLECIFNIDLCLPFATSNEIILSRRGGRNYLQSETRFMQLLGTFFPYVPSDFCLVGYDEVQDELDSIITSSKFDVTKVSQDDVLNAITRHFPNHISLYLHKDSFDYLKTTVGLPISNYLLDPLAARVENLDRMIYHIMGETDLLQKSMNQMKSLLLEGQDSPIQRVMESGVLPKLIEFLQRDNDNNLQLAAIDIMTLTGTSEHDIEIVELGAIPLLVHLLGSSYSDIPLEAALALGNIAAGSPDDRDLVLQARAMQPLLKLLENHQTSDLESVRDYTWVLYHLCGGSKALQSQPDFNLVRPSLSILSELVDHSDEGVLLDACRALHCFSLCKSQAYLGVRKRSAAGVEDMIDVGLIPKLILLLNNDERLAVRRAVVGVFVNMTSKSSMHQIKYVVKQGCIPPLLNLLEGEDVDIVICALKTLRNILAKRGRSHSWSYSHSFLRRGIQDMIDIGVIPKLILLLNEHKRLVVRRTVVGVFVNITYRGSMEQIKHLVDQGGCIPPLLDLLLEEDTNVIINVLKTLFNILHNNKGKLTLVYVNQKWREHLVVSIVKTCPRILKKIKDLRQHADDEVRKWSTLVRKRITQSVFGTYRTYLERQTK